MIKEDLDRIRYRLTDRDFLENKGLSNELGIHVFCYCRLYTSGRKHL